MTIFLAVWRFRAVQSNRIKFNTTVIRHILLPPGTFFKPNDELSTVTVTEVLEGVSADYKTGTEYNKDKFEKIISEFQKYDDIFPKKQASLPLRKMKDSFGCAILNFEDHTLPNILGDEIPSAENPLNTRSCHRQLISFYDVFAVWTSFKHLNLPMFKNLPNPYIMVPSFMDHITMTEVPIQKNKKVRTYGHVARARKTAVEVAIQSDQQDAHGKWKTISRGLFTVAALSPNWKSTYVNRLLGANKSESQYMYQMYEIVKRRKFLRDGAIRGRIPTPEETQLLRRLEKERRTSKNFVSLKETEHMQVHVCEAKHRNRYYKALGGWLIACSEKTACAAAKSYSNTNPLLYHTGHGAFLKMVPIGAHLRSYAIVATTKGNFVFCPVVSDFKDPETGETLVATIFNFVFRVPSMEHVPKLIPTTNRERILYTNGLRYLQFLETPLAMFPTPFFPPEFHT